MRARVLFKGSSELWQLLNRLVDPHTVLGAGVVVKLCVCGVCAFVCVVRVVFVCVVRVVCVCVCVCVWGGGGGGLYLTAPLVTTAHVLTPEVSLCLSAASLPTYPGQAWPSGALPTIPAVAVCPTPAPPPRPDAPLWRYVTKWSYTIISVAHGEKTVATVSESHSRKYLLRKLYFANY